MTEHIQARRVSAAEFNNYPVRGGDGDVFAAEQFLDSIPAFRDAPDEHVADTPRRYVKALLEMTTREEFNFTTFPARSDEMVIVDNIRFVALCAHHLLPFVGVAHIGYVPNERIAGLSKFPRTVKNLAKGLHVQEELNTEIADFLEEKLDPKGVAVVLQSRHMCMELRGIKSEDNLTTTSTMRGIFGDHSRLARQEFLSLIRRTQ